MNETINKEVSDALHMLLHCALKDTEFETQKEQFHIVYDYIEKLEAETNNIITRKKYRQTKKTLKGQIRKLNAVIDVMAEYISHLDIDEDICMKNIANTELCNEEYSLCKKCIKEYFYKKARDNK